MGSGKQVDETIFIIQRKLSLAIFSAGLIVCMVNFISLYSRGDLISALLDISVLILFIISSIVLISGFLNYEIARLLQLSVIIGTAILAIIDEYNSIYGLGLLFITAFIGFKYGYFRRWFKLKFALSLFITSIIIEFSAFNEDPDEIIMHGLDAVIYICLFFFVAYLIYSEDIKIYINKNREKEETIETLLREKENLKNNMERLDRKIIHLQKNQTQIDIRTYGISPAEMKVLEVLILYRETETEIAKRLKLSHHTVKNHFRNIRNKLGVDRREEIIDICRNSF